MWGCQENPTRAAWSRLLGPAGAPRRPDPHPRLPTGTWDPKSGNPEAHPCTLRICSCLAEYLFAQEKDLRLLALPRLGKIPTSCSRSDLRGHGALCGLEGEVHRDRRWKSLEIQGV